MCLILFVHQPRPEYSLVVAANRDEVYDRPTDKVHFWTPRASSTKHDANDEESDGVTTTTILAGKDLRAGGTWMGTTKQGRFAAVTNFREPRKDDEEAAARGPTATKKSRGDLVADFLTSNMTAREFLEGIQKDQSSYYDGFNLVIGDASEGLYHYSNRGQESETNKTGKPSGGHIQKLESGRVYGLCNRFLDYPWPKVQHAKQQFSSILQKTILNNAGSSFVEEKDELSMVDGFFNLLGDTTPAPDHKLPTDETGCGTEFERLASPIFIASDWYGTRASSVLLLRTAPAEGKSVCNFTERSFGPNGELMGEVNENWG